MLIAESTQVQQGTASGYNWPRVHTFRIESLDNIPCCMPCISGRVNCALIMCDKDFIN